MNDFLYIVARDTMTGVEYDSGIRVVPDEVKIRELMITLHRGSTATMYRTEEYLPEGVEAA